MKKRLLNLTLIFFLGGIGGILGCQLFLPWLAGLPLFSRIDWLRNVGEGITVINRTERVTITENQALEEVIAKVANTVVAVSSQKTEKIVGRKKVLLEKPEILAQGSGFILTSDGLIAVAESLVPEAAQQVSVYFGDRQIQAEIKKRDKTTGLALLKINESNLPVVSFVGNELKLGERVFLIGAKTEDKFLRFVDLSIIKQLEPLIFGFETKETNGSPIFNIKGEVIGLNVIDSSGQAKVVLAANIRELLK